MAADHDDLLAGLQRAWDGVTPPPVGGALADEDTATRATVEWLRAAYLAQNPARRGRRRTPALAWRVAAVLLVGLIFALSRGDELPVARPPAVVRSVAAPTPRVLRTTPERIEMRAGAVRLTLLTPQPSWRRDR